MRHRADRMGVHCVERDREYFSDVRAIVKRTAPFLRIDPTALLVGNAMTVAIVAGVLGKRYFELWFTNRLQNLETPRKAPGLAVCRKMTKTSHLTVSVWAGSITAISALYGNRGSALDIPVGPSSREESTHPSLGWLTTSRLH
jgi:hypothetical protein